MEYNKHRRVPSDKCLLFAMERIQISQILDIKSCCPVQVPFIIEFLIVLMSTENAAVPIFIFRTCTDIPEGIKGFRFQYVMVQVQLVTTFILFFY